IYICLCFFFQAEDGIRDDLVTGVQTCALPIWRSAAALTTVATMDVTRHRLGRTFRRPMGEHRHAGRSRSARRPADQFITTLSTEIGRASCRERVKITVGAVTL